MAEARGWFLTAKELEAQTARTLAAIASGATSKDRESWPLFGFFDVDIFDCPPFTMLSAADCPRVVNIVMDKDFELASMRLWCKLAREATCIVDVGAHVGVYALAAGSLRSDIQILAFEPNPYACARLKTNIGLNGFLNIEDHMLALSDKKALKKFGWWKKNFWQISSGGAVGKGSMTVQSDYLDNPELMVDLGDRGLIKIDVEGHEQPVITGAFGLISKHKPDIILETFSEAACIMINLALPPEYRFYRILEDENMLELMPRLKPADISGKNYNAFLTTREPTCLSIS